jgi:hypothetical protein
MLITITLTFSVGVLWLRQLVAGLSPRSTWFASGSVHVGFVMHEVALGQVFLRVLRFSSVSIISQCLHGHISPGRWTVGLLMSAVQRHPVTLLTWKTTTSLEQKLFLRRNVRTVIGFLIKSLPFINPESLLSCCEPVSSVSIMSGYGMDVRAIEVQSPAGAKYFSSILCVPTGSGVHPASCTMGTGGPFSGGKARPGCDADHSHPSNSEVMNE